MTTEIPSITPLPGTGVEVCGVDLSSRPSDRCVQALRDAFARHHLLLVRSQSLTPAQQIEFVGWFGPVLESNGARHGFVSNARPDGLVPEGPLLFHSDMSFTPDPYLGICLHALEVPEDGADTLFADAAAAVDKLPADLRSRVEGRSVRNTSGFRVDFTRRQTEDEVDPRELCHVHPVIGPHPLTGVPVLRVNECASVRIEELGASESTATLDLLFDVLYADDNVYAHHWVDGDVILFDNVAVQHGRRDVDPAKPRTLQRVVMAETSSFTMTPDLVDLYRFASAHRAGRTGSDGPSQAEVA